MGPEGFYKLIWKSMFPSCLVLVGKRMKPGIVWLLDYISPNLLGVGLHKRIQRTLPGSDFGGGWISGLFKG